MDILDNVQKAVKSTIKTLESAGCTSTRPKQQTGSQPWKPAAVKGAIYRNKIMHFKEPIETGGFKRHSGNRVDDWALKNFFSTGEAICRFCFRLASDTSGVFVILNDRIRENYFELTAKELASDPGMPELLCPDCDQNLSSAVETRRKVVEAENKLVELRKSTPVEENESEPETDRMMEPEVEIKSEPMDEEYQPPSVPSPCDYPLLSDDALQTKEGYSIIVGSDGETFYSCSLCNQTFNDKEEQRSHFVIDPAHLILPDMPKSYPCEECSTVLSTTQSFKRHKLVMHGENITCDQCGLVLSCKAIDDHMKTEHPGEFYTCDLCNETFTQVQEIQQHLITQHDKEKPYKCAHCDLWFEEKVYRRIHVNQKHKIQSDWGCLHCGLKCGTKQALKLHLAECVKVIEEETGVKIKMETKVCEICNDTFMNRNDLANHKLRMHTSKYDCPLCASKFTIKKKFEAHVKRHKNVPRPYKCDQCDASYGKPAHLQSHVIRTHTKNFKYHCQYCLKGFIQVGEKVAHERTHTGEKPVACSMCEKRFARQEQLRRHIKRTHSKRKMFRCQWCQRDLSDSRKLFDHVNKFHPEEYNSDVDLDSWSYEIEPEIPDSQVTMPGRPLNYIRPESTASMAITEEAK